MAIIYSGDEEYGAEITSGIFPDGMRDPAFEGPRDEQEDWPDDDEDDEDDDPETD